MPNLAVLGAQWGDEGKGKLVDLLSDRFDVVARFQGGPNAGHTVTFDGRRHALHHVPSGVFRPGVRIVIGNGTVLDLGKLLEEIDGLTSGGVQLEGRLFISDRAHVILPILKRLDALDEIECGQPIGTTLRGIGPTYQAKAARWGVRMVDLADATALEARIARILDGPAGRRVRAAGENPGDAQSIAGETLDRYGRLARYVADTATLLNDWIDDGLSVLFEGAQGTMLDLDHGLYPYVTSSNTLCGALCAGLGVAPTCVTGAIGVYKAYGSRVGAGPFPTELDDGPSGLGEALRGRGREYGTTTGRPRRCGWFDGVAGRYAQRINRFDAACVTLLDVLDDLDEIRICLGYKSQGRALDAMPASAELTAGVEPVYETLPGWKRDTTGIRRWADLPANALAYVERIGQVIGTEVAVVGVGPDRNQSIFRPGSWLERKVGSGLGG
jgi:adenylosuccinate synthase